MFFFPYQLIYSDFPRPWQFSFQKPATTMMEGIIDLHHDVFTFLLIILIFVAILFLTIFLRYLEQYDWKGARVPLMQFQQGHGVTHHTSLEIVWTIIPTLILLVIATPTFALIYALDEIVDPQITIRVVGRQWYWTYEFPDRVQMSIPGDLAPKPLLSSVTNSEFFVYLQELLSDDVVEKFIHENIVPQTVIIDIPGFSYNSYIIPTEDLFAGAFRLLEVDRRLVLPFNTNVRILVTSYDVLHSWSVPAFGVKVDAAPGRLNEYFLNVKYLGLFYGQCSEICGVNHGFMPIKVEIGTLTQFQWWFLNVSLAENGSQDFHTILQ
jgi:cytochrome c oxidase subunit II